MLNFLIFFARFARYFIWNKILIKHMAKSCYKYNNLHYNRKHVKWYYYLESVFIIRKVLRLNPYKRRLPCDVTFHDVLRYMCWTSSVRYSMYLSIHVLYLCLFCYLFIMLRNWENKEAICWRFRSIKIIDFGQSGSDSVWRVNKKCERINSLNLFWFIFFIIAKSTVETQRFRRAQNKR